MPFGFLDSNSGIGVGCLNRVRPFSMCSCQFRYFRRFRAAGPEQTAQCHTNRQMLDLLNPARDSGKSGPLMTNYQVRNHDFEPISDSSVKTGMILVCGPLLVAATNESAHQNSSPCCTCKAGILRKCLIIDHLKFVLALSHDIPHVPT